MYKLLPILLFTAVYSQSQILAFPSAEGFGAYSKGGRNGQVLFVTNLNDYNPENEEPIIGSLRWACDTYGPRTVIFKVSGLIELKTWLTIINPYITIAGQSSPGDGICLKNFGLKQALLQNQNPRKETRKYNPIRQMASIAPLVHAERHNKGLGFYFTYGK